MVYPLPSYGGVRRGLGLHWKKNPHPTYPPLMRGEELLSVAEIIFDDLYLQQIK
jgi:hypothetical protein